jgi:hypothetical protein
MYNTLVVVQFEIATRVGRVGFGSLASSGTIVAPSRKKGIR